MNISVQLIFPVAVTFTPAIAGTRSNDHLTQQSRDPSVHGIQVYTLSSGETMHSVASKFNMTPDSLQKLNQLRTFSRGFENIGPGDELDVPLAPLATLKWHDDKSPEIAGNNADSEVRTRQVAEFTSQSGRILANNPDSNDVTSLARGIATGEASREIQQWLNQFGTARVKLDTDENFSLKNSQFELLLPLFDSQNSLFFTQGGLHRTDNRNQTNLGIGYRYFGDDYMLGANTFLDYDLSRDHARAGTGVEYWRDYMKFSANSYLRLTNWKGAQDLADYEERPANGWDIRAQAWLPSFPQIGGNLTYEQYYGDEVALFGRDNRQRNPHAISAGLNYTPVPLLTFSAEQRQGKSGENDTRFGIELNYQLGVPWQHQIDPGSVAVMRSLAGSRYDLVERNNNIVLEYRKKDVIQLFATKRVTGNPGETKSLGVTVNSKHGLSHIEWSAPALISGGGRLVQEPHGGYSVVLPTWQSGENGVNTYSVHGVAVDIKGNRSLQSETLVTVSTPELSIQQSAFTPTESILPADGVSEQVLTLSLKNNKGVPQDVMVSDIRYATGTLRSATVSPVVKRDTGVYEITVKAGTDVETVTVTPEVNGLKFSEASVAIGANVPVQSGSVVEADQRIYRSGADINITVGLKDANNNPVRNAASQLTDDVVTVPNATAKTGSVWTETGNTGVYTRTYVAGAAGTGLQAVLKMANWNSGVSVTYDITAGTVAPATSAIGMDATTYASGSDMTVSVTLRDASNNPLTGEAGQLTDDVVTVPNATAKTGSVWTETGNPGVYTRTYVAGTTGAGLMSTLTLNGGTVSSLAYAITAGTVAPATSAIGMDATTYASGSDMTVSVTLRDASNNPLTGEAGQLTDDVVTVPNATAKTGSVWTETGNPGVYTRTYVAGTTGAGLMSTLTLNGGTVSSSAYAITAGTVSPATSAIGMDATTYASGSDMTVSVTLRDASNNPLTGEAGQLTDDVVTVPNATAKTGSVWTETGNPGVYTRTYVAGTTGAGLMSTLTLNGGTVSSLAYAITAGTVAPATSAIGMDATTYASGSDMTVSVTLRDASNNPLTGEAGQLTDDVVTVPNATAKTGSVWTETGNPGVYTRTYVAGTTGAGLMSTLTLNGGTVSSLAYAITAGTVAPATSAIGMDATTYASGSDMTVSVTLRDASNNPLTGEAGQLTDDVVTVPNATAKTGSVWTETGNTGVYTRTYVAGAAGTGLQAVLKMANWDSGVSVNYDITLRVPSYMKSQIHLSNPDGALNTWSGWATIFTPERNIMTLTVKLIDDSGQSVTGATALLQGNSVNVQNATRESDWTEGSDGTYSARYQVSTTPAKLLAGKVQLDGWPQARGFFYSMAASPDSAVKEKSSMVVDVVYPDDRIRVAIKLKNAQGFPVFKYDDYSWLTNSLSVTNGQVESVNVYSSNNGEISYEVYIRPTLGFTYIEGVLNLNGWRMSVVHYK
ncbi:inverse autotransporter beta domain-containing protein [Citrobacter meridianamericanus]|uniref:inverse autotransporter beta domain-containing protein n=1 Tax=Citrobacter meridianamericanus TaxID=2894201 RepID=UPI00351CC981